jgi:phosphoglycerate dehydrogenase-like enzyme
MMAVTKRLGALHADALAGKAGGPALGLELDGRTLGLVGLGRIARRVAVVGQALGMTVVAYDPFVAVGSVDGVTMVDLAELLAVSDVVSLHAPATPDTQGLFGGATLAAMKPGSYLINCARGGLVDQDALLGALNSGQIAGAGLDVTDPEPLPAGHLLLVHPNVLVTPHMASSTVAGRRRLYEQGIDNALAVIEGRPASVVPGY